MTRRELLVAASAAVALPAVPVAAFAAQPAAKSKIKRGVSFYSYQEEYYKREMTVEDCFAEVASMGATGVQLIAEEMVPNYPNPPSAWVDDWHKMMATYGTHPTNLDTFVDIYLGGHRNMTMQESVDTLVGQIKLAHLLGFKVVRPTTGPVETPAVEMVQRALPMAEKYDVRIAPEIHAPIPLDGQYIDSYLELIHKTGTKHFGFTMDCGIFCQRLPRVSMAYWARHGVQKQVMEYVMKAFEDGVSNDKSVAAVQKMNPSEIDLQCAFLAFGYGPVTNHPRDLKRLGPYIFNVHGKFYEMTDELKEYSIPYDEVFQTLDEIGYEGSIDSEYEGQRWTQDVTLTDSCEQVRREHVMFRRLLGEV